MIARKYNKRITIQPFRNERHQYGGTQVALEQPVVLTWAEIVTDNVGYKVEQFGLQLFENPVMFRCRYRNDLQYSGRKMVIIYKDNTYIIMGIKTIDLATTEVEIYAKQLENNNI